MFNNKSSISELFKVVLLFTSVVASGCIGVDNPQSDDNKRAEYECKKDAEYGDNGEFDSASYSLCLYKKEFHDSTNYEDYNDAYYEAHSEELESIEVETTD